MTDDARRFGTLLAVAALVWHVLSVLTPAWVVTFEQGQARDFASYYYAVRVGAEGGDPYDRAALGTAARVDGTRSGVHPFLYAPPFLLAMSWVQGFDLAGAFHLWFWLDELCAIASAVVLWRWWRELAGPSSGVIVVACFALLTALPNNHAMGQANFPGLLLALAGLWQTERGRPVVGGALMGAACMLKMSPALFVVWWLVRREWVAVGSAVVAAVVLSVLSLPFAGPAAQLTFYREVLPSFSSGDYNGLGVPITLFGNHSFPNVVHQLFPAQGQLSGAGRALSSMFALGSLAGLAWWFRAPAEDPFARAAQISAFGVLLLLVPVYTYEHHLVFALPAAVLAVAAAERGRLGAQWITPVALCLTVLFFDLQVLKAEAEAVRGAAWWLAGAIQELKFGALLGLLLTMAHLGGGSRAAVVA